MTHPDFERELITHLTPVRTTHSVLVQCLPQLPSNWASVAGNGWVTIRWQSTAIATADVGKTLREDLLSYAIDFRVKQLRGESSLYSVINQVRDLLFGFETDFSTEPVMLGEITFEGTAEDYWVAQGSFMTKVWGGYSSAYVDPATYPDVTEINILDSLIEPGIPNANFIQDTEGGGADRAGIFS